MNRREFVSGAVSTATLGAVVGSVAALPAKASSVDSDGWSKKVIRMEIRDFDGERMWTPVATLEAKTISVQSGDVL